jgi:hypothetical protein
MGSRAWPMTMFRWWNNLAKDVGETWHAMLWSWFLPEPIAHAYGHLFPLEALSCHQVLPPPLFSPGETLEPIPGSNDDDIEAMPLFESNTSRGSCGTGTSVEMVEQLHVARTLKRSVRSCLDGRCYYQACLFLACDMHDRSSGGFKMCWLTGLGGMVARGLSDKCAWLGDRALGGGNVWHLGVGGGYPGEGLHLEFYTPEMGLRKMAEKTSGTCAWGTISLGLSCELTMVVARELGPVVSLSLCYLVVWCHFFWRLHFVCSL